MTYRLLASVRARLARLTRDNRGNIALTFALLAAPLVMAAGASIDLARMSNVNGQVQDIADSAALAGAYQFTSIGTTSVAAAQAAAGNYVQAMAANLPDHPTVTLLSPTSTASTCNLSAPTASPGQLVAQVCATTPVAPNYIGNVQVAITYALKTTVTAMVTPSMPVHGLATAQGGVARQVTVNVSNFNTSAYDLDQIFYYSVPEDSTGTMLTGRALYEYDPTNDIANNVWMNSSKPILSNAKGFTNSTVITLQVPYGSRPAFAMYNTTGGVTGYGSNCYGMTQGTQKKYFSTREGLPTATTTQYYDYQAASFETQPNTTTTTTSRGKTTTTTNVMCPNSQGSNVTSANTTGTDTYESLVGCTSNCQTINWNAGNHVYSWGSSRNPLQFGTLVRDSSGIPTGQVTGSIVTDCNLGSVTYNWDDNGGGGDDNDFNDIVFTVTTCNVTGVLNNSVRLLH